MHDLTANTELYSKNHKMKAVLTPKFRHLSPKRNNIELKKHTIKILNRPIFLQLHININAENFSLLGRNVTMIWLKTNGQLVSKRVLGIGKRCTG